MEQKQEEQQMQEKRAMASSSSSSLFAHPSSLLRQVVHGCAGYLAGLCRSLQNLKPAAPAAVLKQEDNDDDGLAINTAASSSEEVQNVQMRTRAMARSERPVLREGNGGKGGSHHNAGLQLQSMQADRSIDAIMYNNKFG